MAVRDRALRALQDLQRAGRPEYRTQIDFIALALHGKAGGFETVVKMIDDMVAVLKKEQLNDDQKKEYCGQQFDSSDDKKKGLERLVSDKEATIASSEEGIAALSAEIKALEAGIRDLDKRAAEATEQRKEEHDTFTELMSSDSAAKELLGLAKNRLYQFYSPRMYNPPAKREFDSREDRIVVEMGGTAPPTPAPGGIAGTGIVALAEVSAHTQRKDAPPPPPETFGAYTKKSGESTGVIAMIDLLINDLDKEMTEAETQEKDAQADYESTMKDSAEKRALDSKTVAGKLATKADLKGDLEAAQDRKGSATKELMATLKYIQSLHGECDWLLQHFDVRKEARANEVDSLKQAKAVLSGADYSLLQTQRHGNLRRSA